MPDRNTGKKTKGSLHMKSHLKKAISVILAVMMLMSTLSALGFAADTATQTWSRVSLSEITSDDKIAITMTKGDTTWVLPAATNTSGAPAAVTAAVDGDTLTTDGADYGFTFTETDGGHFITNADGKYLYLTNSNNGVRVGGTEIVWSLDANTGYMKAVPSNGARYLGVYNGQDWRCYTTINNNIKDQAPGFWKLTGADAGTDEPEEPAISTVAEALAGATGARFTVKGVITMVDGKNVYVQDSTGGICLFFNTAVSDLALGDTVLFTGARAVYRGLPELTGQTYEKSAGLTLAAKETAIGSLTAADVCTYVKLTGLTVTEVYDNNGGFNNPNITFTDASGASIQLYRAVIGKTDGVWDVAVGDTVDLTAAVGVNNTTLQLRNTLASEITVVADEPDEPETPAATVFEKLTEAPADGAKVVIVNAAANMALSAAASGNKLAGTAAAPADDKLTLTDDMAVLTVTVAEDGKLLFENNGKYLTSTGTGNNLSFADTDAGWTVAADGDHFTLTSSVAAYNGKYNQALEYYNGNFTTYGIKTGNAAYQFDFYGEAAAKTGLVTDLADLTDGANVVIYNPNSAKAMSSDVLREDWYLDAKDVTITDGKAVDPAADLIWTVKVNTDGSYTFEQGDKAVSAWLSGTYVEITSNKAHDGAATGWNLTVANADNNTYYMASSTLSTSYGSAYIELFNKKVDGVNRPVFCGYSTSEAKLTEAAYGMQFYLVDAAAPEEPPVETGDLVTDLAQLTDGATVAIYAPGHGTAISTKPNGDWYLKANAATVENGKIVNFTDDFVWTVKVNADGTYSFYAYGDESRSITVWPSGTYAELSLNVATYPDNTWTLTPAKTANRFYMSSPTVSGEKGPAYVEAYVRNESEVFSGYFTSTASYNFTEDNFGLQFYLIDPADAIAAYDDGEWDGVLEKGKAYVAYNASAASAIGLWDEANFSMKAIPTEIEAGKAKAGNGAYVFKVDTMGRYYTFEIDGKFLAANAAEELFFAEPENGKAPECAKWWLQAKDGGYVIYNKDVTYNGTPVCVEYYSSVFSGWTFSTKNEVGIYLFSFYEVTDGTRIYGDVVQAPSVKFDCEDNRHFEQDYSAAFSLDDLAPEISNVSISVLSGDTLLNVEDYTVSADGKGYTFTVPAEALDGDRTAASFTVEVTVSNSYGIRYTGVKTVENVDEPFFTDLTPAPNAQTGEEKQPAIGAAIGNAGEAPAFRMTLVYGGAEHEVTPALENGKLLCQPENALPDGRVTVRMVVTRADGVSAEKSWSFTVGDAGYKLYFGQLHSHTTYSDGSGTLENALDYVANLPDSANVDFVAFTDHSNYFDSVSAANPADALNDKSLMTDASRALWETYKGTVADFNANQKDLIALAGFEMTWSGGPGHINTFDSDGLVSRNNKSLNDKNGDAGMKLYYETINKGDSINQFNHPGTTFGNFTDFSYRDDATDAHMFLVEVGNGEGQIGAGGYYPSYSEYDLALSKGWHVAPTNNQDNHKGLWGNANDARDVILADSFTEQGIYDAIRALRVYATEDKNLEITYNVNDLPMGTIFGEEKPAELNVVITVYDPDAADAIAKVELIGDEGKTVYTWSDPVELAEGALSATLSPDETYYYVRVTQRDGDLAVTAPVWVGDGVSAGISAFESSGETALVNEETTLTATAFNNEAADAVITKVVYTADGEEIGASDTETTVPAGGTANVAFTYVPTEAKRQTITVTVTMVIDGKEHTYTKDLILSVRETEGALPVTDISDVRANEKEGYEYVIEGVVTSNASGYDKDTAFFDCIYVQDATGGICCFPVSGEYKIGDKVRVEGYTDFYQGEPELQVTSIEVIGEGSVEPAEVTAAQINDFSVRGDLVTVNGTVESYEAVNGLIQTIMVKDENGDVCRVFIDGYITTAKEVEGCETGAKIVVTGLASSDDTWPDTDYFARIRIRDRADVRCGENAENGSGENDHGPCALCGEYHNEKTLRGWLISFIHDIIFVIKKLIQFITLQW